METLVNKTLDSRRVCVDGGEGNGLSREEAEKLVWLPTQSS